MTDVRPVAVIAALAQEAHALVRRMPRAESVGPRLSVWETDGLVVMVSGVGKVAAAMAAQYTCDVFKPRSMIAIGLAGGLEEQGKRGRVIVATGAVQHDIDGRPLTQASESRSFQPIQRLRKRFSAPRATNQRTRCPVWC